MTMPMAFCSRNSALAASYGRMGGSSSSRSSSERSSSWSSGGSSSRIPLIAESVLIGSQFHNPKSKAPLIILALAAVLGAIAKFVSEGGGPGSVLMVQVGISDKDRVLQKKLNKIDDSADTSNVDGLNQVLKGVVKALLEIAIFQSLSCAKYKILKKTPASNTVSSTDYFEFNSQFTDKMRRIKIPLPPVDERRKVVEDVDKDRRYAIDASLVRIMKSRKVLGHQQLVMECVEQLSRMFKKIGKWPGSVLHYCWCSSGHVLTISL